jgi:TRAP transporter 4TM/12TM fusion protein
VKEIKDMPEEQKVFTKHRELQGPMRWLFIVFSAAGIGSAAFYNFYCSIFGWTFSSTGYLFFLLAMFIPLVFIAFPEKQGAARDKIPWYDLLFAALSFTSAIFCFIHSIDILTMGWEYRAPLVAQILSLILLVLVIESARRTGGVVFCLVCIFFACYPFFAHYMPAFLKGKSFPFWRVVNYHAMGPESIIGIPVRVVGTILIGFMVFAVTLQHTGAGKFFLDISQSLLGTVRGGAAKVSIFSSALMGSISGSVISNVLTTGSFTIPAMKKSGYSPSFAGGVEASASSGGTLMPPIMGAAAFVMAEVLGVPYVTVIKAAFLPSILYFFCLFYQADAYAALNGIKGSPKEECPSFKAVMKEGWFYIASVALLIYIVVYMWRESQAGWITTLVLLAMTMIRKETRLTPKKFVVLVEAAGRFLAEITSILAACGLIIGALAFTGVAHSFSHEIVSFAGGNVAFMLILGAFASFVLGMGMTITACYVFLAIVLAPALVEVGFYPLAVHLFVLYWGMASFITPPVALGAFAGATIAGADPMQTGIQAMRLGIAKYFLPFFFVLDPALIFHGTTVEILQAFSTCALGIALLGSALEGYIVGLGKTPKWARPFLFASGLLLGFPEGRTDVLGLILGGAIIGIVLLTRRK